MPRETCSEPSQWSGFDGRKLEILPLFRQPVPKRSRAVWPSELGWQPISSSLPERSCTVHRYKAIDLCVTVTLALIMVEGPCEALSNERCDF
jgi:hypothetical protein